MNPRDWVYDIETYPNVFTAAFKHAATGTRALFEVSDRVNQLNDFIKFLESLAAANCRMIGFNNISFDYPVIHFILERGSFLSAQDIYGKAHSIINAPWEDRFKNRIWDSDCFIQQIDLFKIHHFDNANRGTSLKVLEFNMQSENVGDLPFEVGTHLTNDQIPTLIKYNNHDVDETLKFYTKSLELIKFREELSEKYQRNFLNHNDTRIGKDYFIMRLEQLIPGSCYRRINGERYPRQTIRTHINIADVIFPYIKFKQPGFQRVRDWLASQTITETKGVFTDLSADVDGFKYDFGVGGIHGSIKSSAVETDDDYVVYDWDVASYYPNLAIANNLHPEHLGVEFCHIYQDMFEQRRDYKKGTPENAMLKLALNGVYGDSNNIHSPFYDPQYTMSITINGQLLLCLLAENLINIPRLQMIQINTDGLTVRCPREFISHMKAICKWWEDLTKLELESAIYNRMFIRDVNNYIAEYEDGSIKRKGAYEYELQWHQNFSQLVVPKAAEAALIDGEDIESYIKTHPHIHDFMLRTKIGRFDELIMYDVIGNERKLQKVTRYYVANEGGSMTKISPPAKGVKVGTWKRATKLTDSFYNSVIEELKAQDWSHLLAHELDVSGIPWDERINTKNKSKYTIRRTSVNAGDLVDVCDDINDAERSNINFEYYIKEVKKLVEVLQ